MIVQSVLSLPLGSSYGAEVVAHAQHRDEANHETDIGDSQHDLELASPL